MGTSTDERTSSNKMTKQASAEASSNTRLMHSISANINGVEIIQQDMHVSFIEPHTGGRKKTVSNCNSYGSLTASTSKNKCHAVTFFRRPLKKRRTIYASAAHNSQENKPFAVKTEEGARGSPPPLRVESHTTPCYLFNTTKFENGDVAYLQSSLSARGALTLDTRFEEEPVPSPPPLIRVEGQPTVFNTYAQGVHYTKELVFSTATGLLASPLEAPAKDVKQTGLLSWCEDTKPSLATEKAADVSQLIDEFKRAENNTSCVTEELATIDTEVQPKVAVDTVEHARLAKVTIPASLMTGKLISTAHGLAMLLIPNENMSAADFSTFASAVTNPSIGSAGTKCKHWTKAEDELLKFATSNEGGPPYNWTEIGRNYFPATRSANQCKNRWKKIDPCTGKKPFSFEEDAIIINSQKAGLAWTEIAATLPGRTSDQVRIRFANTIDPSLKKNVAWTAEEDRTLNNAQMELGNKWTQIAKLLPGRSENDVKNRWHNAKTKTSRIMKSLTAMNRRKATLASLRNPVAYVPFSLQGGVQNSQVTATISIKPKTAEV